LNQNFGTLSSIGNQKDRISCSILYEIIWLGKKDRKFQFLMGISFLTKELIN